MIQSRRKRLINTNADEIYYFTHSQEEGEQTLELLDGTFVVIFGLIVSEKMDQTQLSDVS